MVLSDTPGVPPSLVGFTSATDSTAGPPGPPGPPGSPAPPSPLHNVPRLNSDLDASLQFFQSLVNTSANITDSTLRLHDIMYNHNEQVDIRTISGFIPAHTTVFLHPLALAFAKPICASTTQFTCSSFYLCPTHAPSVCIHPLSHQKVCYNPTRFACSAGDVVPL
uniref:Uncharacterized protein n=1 Tax=Lygus hesperus TaxID=30085 RepID=A0A0A9WSH0_LYGHE